ncbi:MAG: heme biosynthesis HemY N-terminal domain-containing protein [Chromatiales bacterium]|jgi:HemY protein
MIRWLVAALLALLIGTTLALLVLRDNGYVLIGYDVWTVEGSLALFVLLDAILFTALYLGIRFVLRLWHMPSQVRHWNHQRQLRRAQRALTRGLLQMAEGDWKGAEKRLIRYATSAETPLLNYLAAARAAQLQGAHDRRDSYLQFAHESMPSADVAVGLTQAELQLAHQQLEQALATLKHLKSIAPKHVYVLKLLSELYQQLGDWSQLKELLPELKRRKAGSAEQLEHLEIRVHEYSLEQAASKELAELRHSWKQIPRKQRHTTALIQAYVRHLLSFNATDDAIKVLQESLRQQWDNELVTTYGNITAADTGKQLSIAEGWLQQQANNPVLLLTLGRLSLKARLWGKARSYLEASTNLQASADAYQELGNLLEQMGEHDAALVCYRKGLDEGIEASPIQLPDNIGLTQHSNKDTESLPNPTDSSPPPAELKLAR